MTTAQITPTLMPCSAHAKSALGSAGEGTPSCPSCRVDFLSWHRPEELFRGPSFPVVDIMYVIVSC